MLQPISNAPRLYLRPSHWWHSVLVLIVDENLFCNIPSILMQSSASNSPRAVHSSLRLPWLWEQPKFATDTELITTDLVQCPYPQTTRSSAALESSRPSESWMWLGTKDAALKICSSYSELKEAMPKNIFSLIRQLMVSQKLIQCSKSKIWYLEIDEMWKPIISWHKIRGYLWICSWLYQTSHMHWLPHWIYLLLGVIVYDWAAFLTTKS